MTFCERGYQTLSVSVSELQQFSWKTPEWTILMFESMSIVKTLLFRIPLTKMCLRDLVCELQMKAAIHLGKLGREWVFVGEHCHRFWATLFKDETLLCLSELLLISSNRVKFCLVLSLYNCTWRILIQTFINLDFFSLFLISLVSGSQVIQASDFEKKK